MDRYEYMVVYTHPQGTGRVCVVRDSEIKSYSDVESLDGLVKGYNGLTAVVVYFKLLRVFTG